MKKPPSLRPDAELFRPRDRTAIGVTIGCGLVLLAAAWLRHGGPQGRLVDIDRAAPLTAQFQVDVNRADWPELMQLPRVGRVLAERIITDREQNGPFNNADDLSRVSGIGPRTLENIRPYLAPIASDRAVARR